MSSRYHRLLIYDVKCPFNINVCRPIHVPLWFQPYSLLLPKQYMNDGVWDTQKNGSSLTGTATAGHRRGGTTTTTATTGQKMAASLIQQAMQTAPPPQQPEVEQGTEWQPHTAGHTDGNPTTTARS